MSKSANPAVEELRLEAWSMYHTLAAKWDSDLEKREAEPITVGDMAAALTIVQGLLREKHGSALVQILSRIFYFEGNAENVLRQFKIGQAVEDFEQRKAQIEALNPVVN